MNEALITILSGINGLGEAEAKELSADRSCSTLPPHIVGSKRDPNAVKNFIIDKMHYHDKKIYPAPPWTYQRLTCGEGDAKQTIIHVTYHPSPTDPPPEKIMETQKAHALALRKLSIIGGLITGLEANGFLGITDPTAKQWLIDRLYRMAEDVRADKLEEKIKPQQAIAAFCEELTDIIHRSGTSPFSQSAIAKHLEYQGGAELWFISQYNRNQTVVFESKSADGVTPEYQIDVPSQPTDKQRAEMNKIFTDPPKWFKKRLPWEQAWLTAHPEVLIYDFKASGHMHTPGAPNARMNYYYRTDKQISRSMRSAILNPFMIEDEGERERITEQNVRQMIDVMRETLNAEIAARPLPLRVPPLEKLIFVQSLVSNFLAPSEAKMAKEELAAIQKVAKDPENTGIKIIATNTPVNATRHFFNSFSRHPTTSSNNEINQLIEYAKRFLGPRPWNNDTILIQAALHNLEEMQRRGPQRGGANYNLMRAATAAVLVNALGGLSLVHCKSGKDRTGLLENTQLTLLKCWQESGQPPRLPSYYDAYDAPKEREHYVQTFVDLFLGRKICGTASRSAPGAFGIKDQNKASKGILCRDIRKALGEAYKSHRRLAKLNMPKAKHFSSEENFDYSPDKIKGIRSPLLPWQAELTLECKQPVYIHQSMSCGTFAEPLNLTISQKISNDSKLEFLFENDQPFAKVSSESKVERLAAKTVREFLALSPKPQDGIEIFGALDPALSRKIEAYCEVMKIPCTNHNTLGQEAHATKEDCRKMRKLFNMREPEPANNIRNSP